MGNLALEYLKVLLSAPVIIFAACILFRQEIKSLLSRISNVELPGGTKISTSQSEKAKGELPDQGKQPAIDKTEGPKLPKDLILTPEQVTAVRQIFEAERSNSRLWEYRYLNFFLVRTTQKVLDWLASLDKRTTVTFFDSFWMLTIPSAEERRAIIKALETHYLIILIGELIEVTPKGKEYLQWRGPLPAETP